jgi:Peptidase A4 family
VKTLASFAAAVVGLGFAGVARADAPGPSTSTNWAGYAVSGGTFTDVKGTWVEPAVTCPTFRSSYSAFWVGLGGFVGGDGNGGLEQIGTDSDCHFGSPEYSAWYEILPDVSTSIQLAISPGDTISAEVNTDLTSATLTITDDTTGQTFATQQTLSIVDATSAEWIAEAPAQCFGGDNCLPLPLADFGTVFFSGSSTTENGHVGTISDASWTPTSIQLGGRAGAAVPAALSPDGSGFSVVYAGQVPQQPVAKPKPKPEPKPKAKAKKKKKV